VRRGAVSVYGPREFREKLAAKNHFLSAVAREKKLFVSGDEREFCRWVKDGWLLAHKSSKQEIANLLRIVARDLKDSQADNVSDDLAQLL
jgi:hypothetical protein